MKLYKRVSYKKKKDGQVWWQERKDLELSLDTTNEDYWGHQGKALKELGDIQSTATKPSCKP